MGGGGKRRPNNRNNDNNNKNKNRSNSRGGSKSGGSAPARIRNTLFVEGGVLSDWSPISSHTQGRNVNNNSKSSSRTGNSNFQKPVSASRSAPYKSIGNTFGYAYPSVELQEYSHPKVTVKDKDKKRISDDLQPIVLVNSKESSIVAYLDESPARESHNVDFVYEYGSSSVLGDISNRGLGLYDEYDASPGEIASSSKQMEENGKEEPCFHPSSSREEMDDDVETVDNEVGKVSMDGMPEKTYSRRTNSAFVSIGGMKLFTQDTSDEESDGDVYGESLDDDSSRSSEAEQSDEESETDGSDDTSSSDVELDEDVAEDYIEGIGGRMNILDAKWLNNRDLENSEEDASSSGSLDETADKLSGIALQEASMEYGMNPKERKKCQVNSNVVWSSALDEFMFVKDPRTLSAKKKLIARLPQSWPSGAQKSKGYRKFPGMKKKHRKESIAQKRRERMRRRGVLLEKINMMLEEMVLDEVDIFHFDPMHHRDCSQVRRLASIYRLHSGCRSCGKLSFVTVTRTKDTCMPSATDKLRLQKLIGAGNEDSDFAVVEGSTTKPASADRNRKKKTAKGSGGRRASFANQPVSFISSGLMESDTAETSIGGVHKEVTETYENNKVGAFEEHTKGFGSKMMAKMGYVEGGGLGKDGQGMAKPIDVVQRPKSLGLGVDFSNASPNGELVKNKPESIRKSARHANSNSNSQGIGAFEAHTKGFGSKMMAKMGFVEGMGLGRDSQGITNPLVAVRFPKSRGLGTKT